MFDLFVEGAMQASIGVPESEIGQIALGLQGEVRFPALSDDVHKGVVTEISKVAGVANAFPVKPQLPIGYALEFATFQPDLVEAAVSGGLSNVYQTIIIVLVVVMLFLCASFSAPALIATSFLSM